LFEDWGFKDFNIDNYRIVFDEFFNASDINLDDLFFQLKLWMGTNANKILEISPSHIMLYTDKYASNIGLNKMKLFYTAKDHEEHWRNNLKEEEIISIEVLGDKDNLLLHIKIGVKISDNVYYTNWNNIENNSLVRVKSLLKVIKIKTTYDWWNAYYKKKKHDEPIFIKHFILPSNDIASSFNVMHDWFKQETNVEDISPPTYIKATHSRNGEDIRPQDYTKTIIVNLESVGDKILFKIQIDGTLHVNARIYERHTYWAHFIEPLLKRIGLPLNDEILRELYTLEYLEQVIHEHSRDVIMIFLAFTVFGVFMLFTGSELNITNLILFIISLIVLTGQPLWEYNRYNTKYQKMSRTM